MRQIKHIPVARQDDPTRTGTQPRKDMPPPVHRRITFQLEVARDHQEQFVREFLEERAAGVCGEPCYVDAALALWLSDAGLSSLWCHVAGSKLGGESELRTMRGI